MDAAEMRKAKFDLEIALSKLVNDFMAETGLTVRSVEVQTVRGLDGQPSGAYVSVDVTL